MIETLEKINDNEYIFQKDKSEMIKIPAGDFLMGIDADDIAADDFMKPLRKIYLDEYYIDKFPVTNRQYKLFIEARGYSKKNYWSEQGYEFINQNNIFKPHTWENKEWQEDNLPVSGVSWYEAEAYANWCGKNLPTEAQWEKAARGIDGRDFPWGNNAPDSKKLCNYNNKIGMITNVNKYPEGVSSYGCFDMAGNVNNWVRDWFFKYFGKYCVENNYLKNPCLDDELYKKLNLLDKFKIDKGGGFATSYQCWKVVGGAWKLFWEPEIREAWHGFRTVYEP